MKRVVLSCLRLLCVLAGCAWLVACQSLLPVREPRLTGTQWELQELNGEPFQQPETGQRFTLLLQQGAHIRAYAGCNQLAGDYQHRSPMLRIGPLAATRMQCPPEQAARERQVIRAMEGASRYHIKEGVLSLLNPIDIVLARYRVSAQTEAPAKP